MLYAARSGARGGKGRAATAGLRGRIRGPVRGPARLLFPCGAAPGPHRARSGGGGRLGGRKGISGWPGRVSINPRVWLLGGFMPEQSHC